MRAIIRFSLNGDNGSLTTTLGNKLIAHGFTKTGTGKYEHSSATVSDIRAASREFWKALSGHTGTASLDHFWMYADA
jgi:hypothetical protein